MAVHHQPMKRSKIQRCFPRGRGRASSGFSLVEVTIAIGIFAFVIVAILGLFPVALRQRSDAALETRGVLIAQQVLESIRSSASSNKIFLPPLTIMGSEDPNLRNKSVGAFPVTLHFGRMGTSALRVVDGEADWNNGVGAGSSSDADALARIRVQPATGAAAAGLYQVTVDYGRPASVPEVRRKNFSFSKLVYIP